MQPDLRSTLAAMATMLEKGVKERLIMQALVGDVGDVLWNIPIRKHRWNFHCVGHINLLNYLCVIDFVVKRFYIITVCSPRTKATLVYTSFVTRTAISDREWASSPLDHRDNKHLEINRCEARGVTGKPGFCWRRANYTLMVSFLTPFNKWQFIFLGPIVDK